MTLDPASAQPGRRFEAAYGPITTVQLVRYAGASGDFNPIHYDHHYAVDAKLGGVIAHGMLTMAFMGRAVTDGLNKGGRVTRISARFLAPVRPGATVAVSVTVTGRREQADRAEIDCELSAHVGEQKVATGEATVSWALQTEAHQSASQSQTAIHLGPRPHAERSSMSAAGPNDVA